VHIHTQSHKQKIPLKTPIDIEVAFYVLFFVCAFAVDLHPTLCHQYYCAKPTTAWGNLYKHTPYRWHFGLTTAFWVPWKTGLCFPSWPGHVKNTFTHFFNFFFSNFFFEPGDPVSIAFSHQAGAQSTQAQSAVLQFQLKHLCFTWLAPSNPPAEYTWTRSLHHGCASAAVNPGLAWAQWLCNYRFLLNPNPIIYTSGGSRSNNRKPREGEEVGRAQSLWWYRCQALAVCGEIRS